MSAAGLNIPFCRSGGISSMKTPPKSYGVSARTSSGLGDRERSVTAPLLFAPLLAGPRQIAIQLREAEFLFLTFLSIPPRRLAGIEWRLSARPALAGKNGVWQA